ncbi:hypothetical protein RJD05_05070 [Ralstonia sp. 11b]|nr:hypothetical protein [Ralstonia sp. 11b]MDR9383734.1 hypothetical protein [Ralstonia sp. 11b]
MPKLISRYLVVVELTILFALVFQCNVLRGVDAEWFRTHQADSEAIVLSGIYHKKETGSSDIPLGFYNYGEGDWVTRVFDHFKADSFNGLAYGEYNSQYGLQGRLFSVIYTTLRTTSRELLESFNSVISGLIFALLVVWARDHYGRAEAIVFAVGVITSTWLIVVSRNLYWVSWTWFLPMLVNGLLLLNRPISPKRWKLVYVAAAVTLLVKSLCGYEYLTSIVIMAMVPVVICLLEQGESWFESAKHIALVGLSSITGFGIALLMHASARAPNLIEGLSLIKQDALRRTMGLDGDPSALQHRGKILIRYIFEWDKPAIAYINLPCGWSCFLLHRQRYC